MQVSIIGSPYNLDQPYTGMGNAPDAILDGGLPGRLETIGYTTILAEMIDLSSSGGQHLTLLSQLLARIGYEVARAQAAGFFPLILGGDCMTAIGVVAGLRDSVNTGVVWIDAHGDFNTPDTTLSGYLGGMPLACIVGRCLSDLRERSRMAVPVPERNVALLGVRDLDPLEEQALAASSVMLVRADDLERDPSALDRALQSLGALSQVYVHVDIDALDPAEAPGVDFPAPGGLTLPRLQEIVRKVAGMGNLAALTLAAVNPEKDRSGRTVAAAIDVVVAALSPVS